jgi:hypothetical protein
MKTKQGLEDISILLDIKEMLEEWAFQTFDMFMMRRGDVSCARANVHAYLCVDVSLGWMSCVYKSSVNYHCKFTNWIRVIVEPLTPREIKFIFKWDLNSNS